MAGNNSVAEAEGNRMLGISGPFPWFIMAQKSFVASAFLVGGGNLSEFDAWFD